MNSFQRVRWRAIAIALAVILVFIAYLSLVVSSPSDGVHLRIDNGWRREGIEASLMTEGLSGLQEGDLVVAIGGRSIESLVESAFRLTDDRPEWSIGDTVVYRVIRDGEALEVPVTLARYPLGELMKSEWTGILTTLSIFLIALFIILKRPFEPAARVFFVAGTSAVVAMSWSFGPTMNMLAGSIHFPFYLITSAGYILLLVAFAHFALVFPKTTPAVSRRAWIGPSIYLIPLCFLVGFGLVMAPQSSGTLHLISRYVWAIDGIEVAFGAICLVAIIYNFRTARDPISRLQIRWVLFSFTIAATGYIISLFLPESFFGEQLINHQVMGFLSLLIPISLAITILRYRLFDIDIIINRTIVYGLLTAGVIGVYVLVIAGLGAVLQTNSNLAGLLLATILAGLLVKSLGGQLQRAANRLVPSGATLSHGALSLGSGDLGDLETHEPSASVTVEDAPPAKKRLRIVHIVWYLSAALALAIVIAFIPSYFARFPQGFESGRFAPNPSSPAPVIVILTGLIILATVLLTLILAGLIFYRRHDDRMGLFLSFYLLAYGVITLGPVDVLVIYIPGLAFLTQFVLTPLIFLVTVFMFAVLPDGRFIPGWNRWIVLGLLFLLPISLYGTVALFSPMANPLDPLIIVVGLALTLAICGSVLYGQIYRYKNVSTRQQQQQIKWIAYGFGIFVVVQLIFSVPWILSFSLPPSDPYPLWLAVISVLWLLSITVIPVSLTIAIMRYRLYDVDVLINRTLVFGAITALIVVMYVLVVGGLGAIFQSSGSLLFALLATGLAALLAQPLRERLQRAINRMMYGERDDPYAVLTQLGKRLEAAVVTEDILPSIVETIANTLKLPYVAILLESAGESTVAASYGKEPGNEATNCVSLPLIHQGESIGHLVMAPRDGAEPFNEDEERLLSDISTQVGVAAHNVRLAEELQGSRERLVTTREEERRRLRRDLHDGLGPTLAGQTLKLDAALDLIDADPVAAKVLLSDLKSQTQDTVARIRRLVYDLRPPALDDLGLSGAIQAHVIQMQNAGNGLVFEIEVPAEDLPPLPAAIEVAAYRIIQEGVTNVVRHAKARECQIRLSVELENGRALILEIEDNGIGLSPDVQPGVGIRSMRERAAEVGGYCKLRLNGAKGTLVSAYLPLQQSQF